MAQELSNILLELIEDEMDMKGNFQTISELIVSRDQKQQKPIIVALLNKILDLIRNPSASGRSKLMSIMLLKEFTERQANPQKKEKKDKLFSFLASSNLLKELRKIAGEIDPYKQVEDKGKTYFPQSKTGNDYIRLILQLLKYWALKFPVNSNKEPTFYKQNYQSLIAQKVNFPLEYKFLVFANKKDKKDEEAPKVSDSARNNRNSRQQPQNVGKTLRSQVAFMHSRISNFLEVLQENDEPVVKQQINKIHSLTSRDMEKFYKMQDDIIKLPKNDDDDEVTKKYLAAFDFINNQDDLYNKYLAKMPQDYGTYVHQIRQASKLSFPEIYGAVPTPNLMQQQKPKKISSNFDSNQITNKLKEEGAGRQSGFDPKALNQVNTFFSKLQQRSKSPITGGFKKITESLSKQKASIIKKTVSPLSKSKSHLAKSITSLKDSKISTIFANPPNRYPPPKRYEGIEQDENMAIFNALQSINKSQGHRRFKTANFKGKSSLFQNQHIQIGYKTEAIYQEINGFKVMLKVELFFGNLTDDRITNLNLQFKGDPSVLLYANPRAIQTSLSRGDQNKIELIVIPIKSPFPLIIMNMRYQIAGEKKQCQVLLPNSVIKLAHFMEINKVEFQSRWKNSQIYKTSQFTLCHYLPPDSLSKWIPSLNQLSSYSTFSAADSKTDYQLSCVVILMQKYQGLLKINIRPNLQVVLQLGIQDKNEVSMLYFPFFLQTLQQFLKKIE